MAQQLSTLMVGYDDVDIALTDFADLTRARHEGRVAHYEAAVLEEDNGTRRLVETTVDARHTATIWGAGHGLALGVLITPAFASAAVGAGLGGIIGNLIDQLDAFEHAAHERLTQLMDGSHAVLVVLADDETVGDISLAALRRDRRVVAKLDDEDVEALERELRRITPFETL